MIKEAYEASKPEIDEWLESKLDIGKEWNPETSEFK